MSVPETSSMLRNGVLLFVTLGTLFGFEPSNLSAQQPVAIEAPLTEQHVIAQPQIETPPKAAQVTCEHGLMTILAENSTLGNILAGVQTCLGVKIDVPVESATQRFYINSAPAPVRAKLDELLSATGLNYVIQEGPALPYQVHSILLMARSAEIEDPKAQQENSLGHTMTPARRAWLASRETARGRGSAGDESEAQPPDSEAAPAKLPEGMPTDADSAKTGDPQIATMPSESPKSERNGTDEDKAVKDGSSAAVSAPTAAAESVTTAGASAAPQDTLQPSVPQVPESPADASQQSSPTPAQSEFQNKVDQMQKMFEERKAITPTSVPQSPPS